MAEIPDDVKVYVVTQLARRRSPSQVALAVKEAYGVEMSRQAVHHYDPTRTGAPPTWKALYEKERRKHDKVTKREIPTANGEFRMRELQEMYYEARGKGNTKLAAALLEQIADEEDRQRDRDRKQGDGDQPKETEAEKAKRIRDALFQMDESMNAIPDAA